MSIRATEKTPCPHCGRTNWPCAHLEDGAVICRETIARPGWRYIKPAKDGCGVFAPADGNGQPRPVVPFIPRPAPVNQEEITRQHAAFVQAFTLERKAELAAALSLPVWALDVLPIGWTSEGWAMPESDAGGNIVGLNVRYPDGSKRVMPGHRRGLTLPTGWRELPDPVLVVEGASDVLAGRALGLNVIGRPGNNQGAELIAGACRGREIIILGENDRKPDKTWPGFDGAMATSRKVVALCKP